LTVLVTIGIGGGGGGVASASQSLSGSYIAYVRVASSGTWLELALEQRWQASGRLLQRPHRQRDSGSANSRYLAGSLTRTKTVGHGALFVLDTSTLESRLVTNGVISGASFNRSGTQLVFGKANSLLESSPVDLYTAAVAGGRAAQLTTDGNSFDTVWVRPGIVFDGSTPCGVSHAPIFQLWL
jgi:hypothetical protein